MVAAGDPKNYKYYRLSQLSLEWSYREGVAEASLDQQQIMVVLAVASQDLRALEALWPQCLLVQAVGHIM